MNEQKIKKKQLHELASDVKFGLERGLNQIHMHTLKFNVLKNVGYFAWTCQTIVFSPVSSLETKNPYTHIHTTTCCT